MISNPNCELTKALVHQVITDVYHPLLNTRAAGTPLRRIACKVNGGLGNLRFRAIGMPRDLRNPPAVELAAFKVHLPIRASWILTQKCVEDDQRFDEEFPVDMV